MRSVDAKKDFGIKISTKRSEYHEENNTDINGNLFNYYRLRKSRG